jgi:hypothetical protein
LWSREHEIEKKCGEHLILFMNYSHQRKIIRYSCSKVHKLLDNTPYNPESPCIKIEKKGIKYYMSNTTRN